MKKFLSWLVAGLFGLVATVLSISFESNIGVLISMALLLMIPLGWIMQKTVRINYAKAQEKEAPLTVVNNLHIDADMENELRRRESMRTEASELQAELSRINEVKDPYQKLKRMGRWRIKSDIHQSLYSDIYETVGDYLSDVDLPKEQKME